MESKYKVSIVIPAYNNRDLLERNLPSLMKAVEYKNNRIFEVIVVDDVSSDNSADFIKNKFSQVKLIRQKKHRGFSSTINLGVRSARGNLIVLLNTDVKPEKDFLENTLKHFDDNDVFAVSLHEVGYGPSKAKFVDGFIAHSPGVEGNVWSNTFWVSGGSGVFRRSKWMELGGFDEKMYSPFYWEDVDLSYRALKQKFKLIWEPRGIVFHEHEGTTGKISKKYRQRIQDRNQLLLIWKNLTSPRLFRKHIVGLLKRMVTTPGYIRVVFMALFKLSYVIKSRKKQIKESKVSDEAIFGSFK